MSENLNWLDQLKKSFQGFEPEVSGDWKRMEQNLDALNAGTTNEMARRMRNAQRIAIGATAIAAGMALWVITPTILEEENATGSGAATTTATGAIEGYASDVASSAQSLFSPAGDATDVFPSEGARTSNTFVIDLPSLTVTAVAPSVDESSPGETVAISPAAFP